MDTSWLLLYILILKPTLNQSETNTKDRGYIWLQDRSIHAFSSTQQRLTAQMKRETGFKTDTKWLDKESFTIFVSIFQAVSTRPKLSSIALYEQFERVAAREL
jgi:hypothetical protein